MPDSVRVAAIGDLHIRTTFTQLTCASYCIEERADFLIVPGDITNGGRIQEVELAAELFNRIHIPIVGVMGNHDRRTMRRRYFLSISRASRRAHARWRNLGHLGIGIAGVSGSGGGFWPDEPTDPVSNRAWQALAIRARREAARLDDALGSLETQRKWHCCISHRRPRLWSANRR